MKIKYDFITNSSTTCFILIVDRLESFTKDKFIENVGIKRDSKYIDVFSALYDSIQDDLGPFRKACIDHRWNESRDCEKFVKRIFSDKLWDRIIEAEKSGKKVYMGSLASDNDAIESYFCCDSFIIESKEFYLDATNDSW